MNPDFAAATARALDIRRLYELLETHFHGRPWTPQELMVGYLKDVGDLGSLVMASQDRWVHQGDLPADLGGKLSEWSVVGARDRRAAGRGPDGGLRREDG